MTQTTNHEWDIPTVGADEGVWGEILNDFFDDELDRQVTLEGPLSERPNANSESVKYYHATDEERIYYNDGTDWNLIVGSIGDDIASTSHGNESHSSTFAVDGDEQPPEEHGDNSHEYELQIDGLTIGPDDTINFQT